ncbi:MAG: thioredoxin family protein [Saprospiraceae bacterium]|nr:thioredoxin family protein [Saprospiraceae bacterium]
MKSLVLYMIGFAAVAMTSASYDSISNPYSLGDQVDDFKLQNVDQEWIQLSEYKGEMGVIIIFTCNTCPYAQLYEDRIIDLHNTYKEKGFPVLAINPNDPIQKSGDSFEKMKIRSEEKAFTFPYVFDADQEIYPRFGATNTPQVFLLDDELQLRYTGAIDDNPQNPQAVNINYVENAIEAIVADEDPNPAKTKAIGCGIKAKKAG